MRQAVVVLLLAACATSTQTDEQEVRATVAAMLSGLEHLDAAAVAEPFAEDATVFFPETAGEPLRVEGQAAIRAVFARFFDQLRRGGVTSMKLEPSDLRVDVAGDAAVVTFHLRGSLISRRTFVLRRRGRAWQIIHLHASNVRP